MKRLQLRFWHFLSLAVVATIAVSAIGMAQAQPQAIAIARRQAATAPPTPVQISLPSPPAVPSAPGNPVPTPDNAPPQREPDDFVLEELPATPVDTAGLTLGDGTYQTDRFQVGIIDGYNLSVYAGVPTIESDDKALAYTALAQQRANNRTLANDELVQAAIETLDRGEGFRIGDLTSSSPEEVVASWTGSIDGTLLSGRVLVRQVDRQLLVLVVSATEDGTDRLDGAIAVLSPTLQPAPVREAVSEQPIRPTQS